MLGTLDFQQIRVGYLYGNFEEYREPTAAQLAAAKVEEEIKRSSKKDANDDSAADPLEVNKCASVRVELIYEPPQNNTDSSFELLEDPMADQVEAVATALGLVKVGWVIAHPLREDRFNFSG